MDVVDQSVGLTRKQRGKFTKIVLLCLMLFGFALVDTFRPEWKKDVSSFSESMMEKAKPWIAKLGL